MARLNNTRSASAWYQAITLAANNAEHPPGQHWDLSANAYVDDPTCEPGYHWDISTYRCVPD